MTGKGEMLEFRTTRLLFKLGYFTRRGVQLKSYFYPETSDITDIDSYGIRWNLDLSSAKTLAMCTTERDRVERGTSNRILLVRGLKDLIQGESSYLVMEKMSKKLRAFSMTNQVIPIDTEHLAELEANLELTQFFASNVPSLKKDLLGFWDKLKELGRSESKRHYWFLISDFWFMESNLQIKRLLSHVDYLCSTLVLKDPHEKWMYIESAILLSMALLIFSFEVSCQPVSMREDYIRVKMIEGISTVEEQERIRRATYNIVASKVKEITGESFRIADSELEIPPPEYTPKLTELVLRIIKHAQHATSLCRLMDYFLYETVMWGNELDQAEIADRLMLNEIEIDFVAKLGKNVIHFMDPRADEHDFLKLFLNY